MPVLDGADRRAPAPGPDGDGARRPTAVPVLRADDVSIRFGGLQALTDVSVRVEEFEIVGLIGPNGAGKTTIFNCITGFYRPQRGRILFKGEDVSDLPPHERSALGMGRTFQNVGLVKTETVIDNMLTAQHAAVEYGAVKRINEGIELCRAKGDTGSRELLQHILVQEEEHVNWLEAQQTLLEQVGEQGYLAEQIKES